MSDMSEFSTTYNMKSHTPQPRAEYIRHRPSAVASTHEFTSAALPASVRPPPRGPYPPAPTSPHGVAMVRVPAPRLPHQPWPPSPTTASSALDGATMTALWKREWRTKRGKAISMMSSSASLGPEGQGKCLESRAFVAGALLFRCRR